MTTDREPEQTGPTRGVGVAEPLSGPGSAHVQPDANDAQITIGDNDGAEHRSERGSSGPDHRFKMPPRMPDGPLDQKRLIEAVIFASAQPVDVGALAARLPTDVDVSVVLRELQSEYRDRGVRLTCSGAGWAFRTADDLGRFLDMETMVGRKLSRAAVETLAIVAYHQPVTRADIEDIRSVALSRGTLDTLLEAGWLKPCGRRRAPGRPMTWGTTDAFLDHFGLASLDDLPGIEDLRQAGLLDSSLGMESLREQVDADADARQGDLLDYAEQRSDRTDGTGAPECDTASPSISGAEP